ncbi:unnamed protein product [Toxocara canis]|uniref:Transmembrane protein n=1 Tax=Toxocara canis TaxID=6265 RepID=A0A183U6N9_TOXCA|nr:unnamed protein product [Toxocara canis]
MYRQRNRDPPKHRFLAPQLSHFERGSQVDVRSFQTDSLGWRLYYMILDLGKETDPFDVQLNSISVLDRCSRIVLPIAFASVVIIYYNFYVNTPHQFVFDEFTV